MNLLTAVETAEWLRVHIKTVRRLCRQRKIPFYRIGGRLMFSREEILRTGRRPTA